MTARLKPSPVRTGNRGSDLDHVYCCDPSLALCGADISDQPEIDDDRVISCVVCNDLEGQPCTC